MKQENIVTILVSPENSDNIGAAARAIKNMGFSELRLVRPPRGWRGKAKKMAMSAGDILQAAATFSSLSQAVRDLSLVVGTTRRIGGHRGSFLSFDAALVKIKKDSLKQKVGIVFGRESKGLANNESALCDHLIIIPTGASYPSINLAQAVMILSFALSRGRRGSDEKREKFLNKKETEQTIACFENALKALGYKKGGADLLPRILKTFRGLLKRSGLLRAEAQMIKGLSRKIREKVLS
ncbi:MAG TPA: RNA methyltransferase [Candidatus Omnitrophota bacterium]|nr:RNA methyltransferase [Candidatus Omnitrophota bacterium]HRY86115.1 RNA methyltransferase [Candidatus Omnitrophota bacterium]